MGLRIVIGNVKMYGVVAAMNKATQFQNTKKD